VGYAIDRREKGSLAADGSVAGYAEHADRKICRLVQTIEDLGELDNTIVIYIAGDNGGTAIGGLVGEGIASPGLEQNYILSGGAPAFVSV
jgi:arylsulfatase A-like enzyme